MDDYGDSRRAHEKYEQHLQTVREKCVCCENFTIEIRHFHEVCPICYWEDALSAEAWNHGLTLEQAKENFIECGAILPEFVQYVRGE